jgi:hypothetical protein
MLQGPPPPPVQGGLADLLGGPGGPGVPPGGPGGPPAGLPPGLLPTPPDQASDDQTQGQQGDPLGELQDAVGTLHTLMQTLPDPADVDQVAQALKILTGVQKRQMTSGPGQTASAGQ